MRIQGQYITLDEGYKLHVVTSGPESAPPLLLLHCWTGNWTQWETTMRHLDGQYRFIVPDQLGFGGSNKPIGDHYQIDRQAERAYQILQHLGYDQATVIGHSMGGMIALTLAGTHPQVVKKLIVVDPAVTGRTHPLAQIPLPVLALGRRGITQPIELLVNIGQRIPVLGSLLLIMFFANPFKHADAVQYWGYQTVVDGQAHSIGWAQKAIHEWDTTPLLSGITAPTLAIWGEKDYTVPLSECFVLERHVPDCRARRIPDIGHFPMVEAWDGYIQAVQDFLAE